MLKKNSALSSMPLTPVTDFNRPVYCLLGLPFDAITVRGAIDHLRQAAAQKQACFLSTPNLNFLIGSSHDPALRDSVIESDLSVADGMPIVWLARLLGLPIVERVAGSNVFQQLGQQMPRPMSVYFFGGQQGVADMACKKLNAMNSMNATSATAAGLHCVGVQYPGLGTVEEMSGQERIDQINASGADFLVVALSARKGQAWIQHNRARIAVPVISHLGAVVNFVAGTVKRAPVWMQRAGLEWLWRIKEEPALRQRYSADGAALLRLLWTRVLPYAWFLWRHPASTSEMAKATLELLQQQQHTRITLTGAWTAHNLAPLRPCFAQACLTAQDITLELARLTYLDSALIGLLMLLHGSQQQRARRLHLCNVSPQVKAILRWNGAEFLLS